MSIRTILFVLFLYICLVWVIAFRIRSGAEVQDFGLLWTAVGLISVLALIVLARLFGWWRLRRAKAVARPAAPVKPAAIIHEDDAALSALIAEANRALAKSPAYAAVERAKPFCGLPVYILIGPEGSGKTSTFLNSGVEPQLLAGDSAGSRQSYPTRLCNIWLARDTIFIELCGRVFSGDPDRWRALLRGLQCRKPIPAWRRLWGESEIAVDFRGAIGFCDVKELTGASADPQRFERYCRDWQERLRAAGAVFRVPFPVYQVISKCDAIPFFPDFFRRLPEAEAAQIFGSSLPLSRLQAASPGEVFADSEAKRLTASFRVIYRSIAQRRLSQLANEPQQRLRPAIYEFPRELKRIRSSLVQFLTDSFRPHPLEPGPLLRGYYLTGVRQVETAADPAVNPDWGSGDMEASRLFRGDATRIFSSEDFGKPAGGAARKGSAARWVFVSDLFHRVVLADPPLRKAAPVDAQLERYRRAVFAGVTGLCVLLCIALGISWVGNRSLLQDVAAAATTPGAQARQSDDLATLSDLQSLDALRGQLETLRRGAGWSLHWGLYAGNRVLDSVRVAYFSRFQRLLLNRLNDRMVESLAALPAATAGGGQSEPAYRLLKTHLMITSGSCNPDPGFIAASLKKESRNVAAQTGPLWHDLADRQIDFYSREFPYGNPCRLREDTAACSRARQYLQQLGGMEEAYRGILSKVEKTIKPLKLSDSAANYAQVLSGSNQVNGVFTPEGWKLLEKESKERNTAPVDSCVIGHRTVAEGDAQAIQRLYIREYIDTWRKYLAGFSVLRYSSSLDAARKLDILADHKSPLLGLLALVSTQTQLAAGVTLPGMIEKVPGLGGYFKKGETEARKAAALRGGTQGALTTNDIVRSFQPVHWVVPPDSENWVVADKNGAYVDALGLVRKSMQDIAGDKNNDPATYPAARDNYEKALETVRQIAKGFIPVEVDALDGIVQRLLEEPIRNAKEFINPPDPGGPINADLKTLCTSLKTTLGKYPFMSSSPNDTTLAELTAAFAPGTGSIWKFQAQSLGELIAKEGPQWKVKDPAKKPQLNPDLLTFLNRAQNLADVFFARGPAPQMTYALRPVSDATSKDWIVVLDVDGQHYESTSSVRHTFTWPAESGLKDGAQGRIHTGSGPGSFPFASRGGKWGIFKIMGDADPRAFSTRTVEWKNSRGGDGRLEQIDPPVRLEIAEFPGGVDIFNPGFFKGFGCPAPAAK